MTLPRQSLSIGRMLFACLAVLLGCTLLAPLGAHAAPDALYDQLETPTSVTSSVVASDGYEIADDVTVPAGTQWTITQILAGAVNNVPVTLSIYQDAGGHPGDQVYQAPNLTASSAANGHLAYSLPTPATLGAGTYWIGYIAQQQYILLLQAPVVHGSSFLYRAYGSPWYTQSAYDTIFQVSGIRTALSYSPSMRLISAPPSVVEGALESDQAIQFFPERLAYTLPQDLTITAQGAPSTVIPAGTKVNVYYLHADKIGNTNSAASKLSGSVTFDSPILAVLSSSAALLQTNASLGNTQNPSAVTAYSTRADQGIESDDTVTINGAQNQVTVAFNVWNMADNVRVITRAP